MKKHRRYLLDTNIVSYAVKADWKKQEDYHHWISRHLRLHQEHSCLPSIAVEEITYGIHRNGLGQSRTKRIERWLKQLPKLTYDEASARIAGKLRAELTSNGIKIDDADIQIAAIALRYKLTLVTRNVKDFANIPNLKIENWAQMPMSMEMFLKSYVADTMRLVEVEAALLISLWAYYWLAQLAFTSRIGQGLLPFFLNVFVISLMVGMILALCKPVIVKICIILQRQRII